MLLGYARVSTDDQQLHLQHDALNQVGCDQFFADQASGAAADRPGLRRLLAHSLCVSIGKTEYRDFS